MKSTKIALVSLFLSLTLVSVEAIGQTETGNGWVIRQGIDEKAGGPIVGGERKTIDGQNDVILMFAHSLKKSWVLGIKNRSNSRLMRVLELTRLTTLRSGH